MKRTIALPVEVTDYGNQTGVIVRPDEVMMADWCLNICLLDEGLIDALIVGTADSPLHLEIGKYRGSTKVARGVVTWGSAGFRLDITKDEIDYWKLFYLRYYRDGSAEVSHIDVDIATDQLSTDKGLFLTLTVPLYTPPISESELRHRLDMRSE